jgi:hypothetical protein
MNSLDLQQFKFWLNKGSSFKISYDMTMGHGKDSLILAIVKGGLTFHSLQSKEPLMEN